MIAEVANGDYLSDDQMNKFGQILTFASNGTFRPLDVLLIGALDYVHPLPVNSPHIQLLSGVNRIVGDVTHWICLHYDASKNNEKGPRIHVYDSLNTRSLSPLQREY